jgi:hypothetical protein
LSSVTTVGLDLAKHVFQVHGVDASGRVAVKGSAEAPDEARFAGRDIMTGLVELARRYVALNDELESVSRADQTGGRQWRGVEGKPYPRRAAWRKRAAASERDCRSGGGAEDYRTVAAIARHGNRGGGEGDGRKDQHDRRAIEAHEGEGPDGRRRRLDRTRLTKAEEIADLVAPAPPCACPPWIKPIAAYIAHGEEAWGSFVRFG